MAIIIIKLTLTKRKINGASHADVSTRRALDNRYMYTYDNDPNSDIIMTTIL